MNLRDIVLQMNVYHAINVQYGRGTVKRIIRGPHRATTTLIAVAFDGVAEEVICKTSELRKSPNRGKIKLMLAEYFRLGVEAVDGWDCVVIPEQRKV